MSVWMVDVDADELASAKEVVVAAAAPSAPAGATIESRVADVSDAGALTEIADKVYAGGGGVHLLMNNAGVGRGGALADAERLPGVPPQDAVVRRAGDRRERRLEAGDHRAAWEPKVLRGGPGAPPPKRQGGEDPASAAGSRLGQQVDRAQGGGLAPRPASPGGAPRALQDPARSEAGEGPFEREPHGYNAVGRLGGKCTVRPTWEIQQ